MFVVIALFRSASRFFTPREPILNSPRSNYGNSNLIALCSLYLTFMCRASRSGGSRVKSNGIYPLHYCAGLQRTGFSIFVFHGVFYLSNINYLINIFQMCVNADVRKEKGASLNHSCRALVSAQACKYHRNVKGGYRRVNCRRISRPSVDAAEDFYGAHSGICY